MPCDPEELRHVPLFELLDEDEAQVLAAQVEIRQGTVADEEKTVVKLEATRTEVSERRSYVALR